MNRKSFIRNSSLASIALLFGVPKTSASEKIIKGTTIRNVKFYLSKNDVVRLSSKVFITHCDFYMDKNDERYFINTECEEKSAIVLQKKGEYYFDNCSFLRI